MQAPVAILQVWRTLRAMPLRLLERVMPWLAAKLPEPDIEEMLATVRALRCAVDLAHKVSLITPWNLGQSGATHDP